MHALATHAHGRNRALAIGLVSLLLGIAIVLFGVPEYASAMEAAVCTSCHGAAMDFSVPDVNRDTACKACHLGFAGSHPMHQAGSNCAAACHAQWGDSLLTATPRYTDPTSGAAFASAASKSTPAEELHVIHSAPRWPGGVDTPSSACTSCHAAAACNACHTGAVAGVHAQHSATGNAQVTARAPWAGTVGYGVIGGDQTQHTAFDGENQCATAGCHNLAATVAARPVFVEDYNHAVGANPDNPTVASTAISLAGTWRTRASTLYSGNRMSYNNVAGSTLTASFTGGRIELVADKDPYRGQAEVLIDGAVVATIDCYAPATQIQAVVFVRDVAQGSHTITVRPTGLKDPAARGTFVVVDAFNVYPVSRGSLVPECDDCHVAQSTDHGARDAHDGGVMDSWCLDCHTELNLMTLHEPDPRGCIICHGTTDATVKAAVLAGDKRCITCHEQAHASGHTNANNACAGPGCHVSPDLVNTHAAIGCDCHSSADSRVVAAIAADDKRCPSCHNPVLVHGAVHEASATYAAPTGLPVNNGSGGAVFGNYYTIKCLSCHRTNLLANHGSDYTNCAMCHADGGPRSSFTTWDKNCQTAACHPGSSAPHPAEFTWSSAHYHEKMSVGEQPAGMCQSCHGNPEGWQCGSSFGCHTAHVGPSTSVDYLAPVTAAVEFSEDPLTWKLNVTDQGDGVIATYYSFDGAPFTPYTAADAANGIVNPADASPPYAHTLRYYSVDAAGHTEAVKTTNYDVSDTTPPVVTFNGVDGLPIAKSLTMTVTDPKVNGLNTGVAFVHTEVRTFKTQWGWTLTVFYQNMADFSFPLDTSWDSPRELTNFQNYAIAKNSYGFWETYQYFPIDTGDTSGRFEMQYYARDYAGNQTPMQYAYVWIDNGAPTTTTSSAGAYRWKLNATDVYMAGVATTYYKFDSGVFTTYTAADALAGVANGEPGGSNPGAHTLQYYSVDKLGNTEAIKTLNYSIP